MAGDYTIQLSDGITVLPVIHPLETDGADSHQIAPIQTVNLTGGAGINYFSVSSDLTQVFVPGFKFSVFGSFNGLNNGIYTVVPAGSTFSVGFTNIPVIETIPNNTLPLGSIEYSILSLSTPRLIRTTHLRNPITAVTTGLNGTFRITGDYTSLFTSGFIFFIAGSTGNNGQYTTLSSTLSSGNTIITVSGTILNATADGYVSDFFTLSGDLTYRFTAGFQFITQLSGGADGVYTVSNNSVLTVISPATQGYQIAHFSSPISGPNPTGLANNATIYTARVYFTNSNGVIQTVLLNITGSTAQTFSALLTQINTALGANASATIVGGDIKITSLLFGSSSVINTIDTSLFSSLTNFSSFYNPVKGTDPNEYTTIPVVQAIPSAALPAGQIVYSILPQTALALPGKGNLNYGQHIVTDFVRLLENFAGPAEPAPSLKGQLWFDTNSNIIHVFDGFSWMPAMGSYVLKTGDIMSGILDMGSKAGYQTVNYNGTIIGSNPTGLANNATVYSATVAVDGGAPIALNITGSTAQTFTALVNQINIVLGVNATATIIGGNIRITSATTGLASSISIVDTNLFSSTTGFVAILAAVAGGPDNKIINLADATNPHDALNLETGDIRYVNVTGDTMTGALDMSTNKITNLGNATSLTDALNIQTADGRYVNVTGDTMTGVLKLAAGTAAAPSLSFTSDATKGMYDSGAGEISFAIGGVQKVKIDSGGITTFSGYATTDTTNVVLWNTGSSNTGIAFPVAGQMEIRVGGTAFIKLNGTNVDLNSHVLTGLSNGTNPTDALNVQTGDLRYAPINGLTWLNPILDPNLVDDSLSTPPITPITNTVYLIGPTATGAWTGLEGHVVYWNGSSWIDSLNRAVIIGDRFGITFEGGSGSEGGNMVGNHNKIAQLTNATPGSYAYTFTTPINTNAVFVSNDFSQYFGQSFTYSGASSSWVEFGGPSAILAGNGLSYTGNTLNIGTASSSRIVVNADNIDLATTGISAGTYTKLTVDVYGRATVGATAILASSDFANQGTTTTVLHGNAAGNPSFSAVVEADISLSNVTTNNVTTVQHGFVPVLPNDSSVFFNGVGGYTDPTLVTENSQSTDYTLVLSDKNKLITLTGAVAHTFTVPDNATVAFPIGTTIGFTQDGSGQLTIAATGGVTIRTEVGYNLNAQYAMASMVKVATDTWRLSGSLKV